MPRKCVAGDPSRGYQGHGEIQGEVRGKVMLLGKMPHPVQAHAHNQAYPCTITRRLKINNISEDGDPTASPKSPLPLCHSFSQSMAVAGAHQRRFNVHQG